MTIVHFYASGQAGGPYKQKINVDTLSVRSDSVLAKISTYINDTLVEEKTAFLFPDSIQISRFRHARNLFRKTVYVARLLKHGKTVKYSTDNKKKITLYSYGKELSTIYYDKNNNEISEDQFSVDKHSFGPCGIVMGEFLILEQKRNQK